MKSESKELSLFLLIFLGLFLVWIVTGGPDREISKGGKFLKPLAPVDSGETYDKWQGGESDNNSSQKYLPDSNQEKDTSLTNEEIAQKAEELKKKIEELEKNIKYSEFNDMVSFQNYGQEAEEDDPSEEYLKIKADRNNTQGVPITGWTLESLKSGKKVSVPEGAMIPNFGSKSAESDIVLEPGETAYLITGDSPIGVSFKINKCAGYFEQFQDFVPSISKDCPSAENELDSFEDETDLTQYDLDYIDDLSRCYNPLSTPANLSNEARSFLSNFMHYSGCVDRHEDDEDFYENYWMVYFGKSQDLWEGPFETIHLLDEEGKLVDEYSFE